MSTANSKIKNSETRRPSSAFSGLLVRLGGSLSAVARKLANRAREAEAAELLEFALALPMILVMVVGLLDFSRAYNLKQKLANAAREGARVGASASWTDRTSADPPSVHTIKDDVTTYLVDAGVNTSFIGSALSWTPCPGSCTGTYYTTSGTNTYGLKIERNVKIYDSSNVMLSSTRVTLYYPYDWTFGFDHVIKLLVPSSTFTSPITIQTDAVMRNIAK